MFREENEAVSALLCSDTVSDTLCVALSFSPYNIAFGCTFLCFIKITFVCLADWDQQVIRSLIRSAFPLEILHLAVNFFLS